MLQWRLGETTRSTSKVCTVRWQLVAQSCPLSHILFLTIHPLLYYSPKSLHHHHNWRYGSLHTIVWCVCSAMYTLLLKRLLDTFPYPLTITMVVLGTQALYSMFKWTCLASTPTGSSTTRTTTGRKPVPTSRRPAFRRFKRRHWQKLVPAALSHGVGSILSIYAALLGPAATSVLIQLLPRPFWSGSFPTSQLILCGVCLASVSRSESIDSASPGYYIYIVQVVAGVIANLAFVARSRIRISTHRFNGAQNVFEVTCALSVVALIIPLTYFVDGVGPLLYLLLELTDHKNPWRCLQLGLLGVLYCINNEITFLFVSRQQRPALLRGVVSWIATSMRAPQLFQVLGALLVFGVTYANNPSSITPILSKHSQPEPLRRRAQSTDSYTSTGSMSYTSLRNFSERTWL